MKMKKLLSAVLLAALVTSLIPTFSQAEEVTYEEKDSGSNMGEAFTASAKLVYGQTPSFTVKIPKNIDLDGEGAGKYTVGVKGKIPSKYVVNVVPDETITMEEENSLLDSIVADVTAEKTTWAASELSEDSYAESTNNTIQMQSIDFAKFKGTLNFNVSATMPVELKDASDEVKSVNKFLGIYDTAYINTSMSVKKGDIIYTTYDGKFSGTYGDATIKPGYYQCVSGFTTGPDYLNFSGPSWSYLGESYKV